MPKVSQNAESVEKKEEATKSQQQPTGPGRPSFGVCVVQFDTKINDSCTKLEGASVQGVQQ